MAAPRFPPPADDVSPVARVLAYHRETSHSPESVRRGPHGLDFSDQPLPFKLYPTLTAEPLPPPEPIRTPALRAIGVAPPAEGRRPDPQALAQILHFSAGIVRGQRGRGGQVQFRAASCTGALYHIDGYVVCGDLPGLPAGVYHFGPHDHALRRLRAGDFRPVLVRATAGEAATRCAPATLIFASTFWRNAWKYRTRAYRHVFWDTGTILANVLAVCAGIDVPARLVLGFLDAPVNHLLGLDGRREGSVAVVPLGTGPPAPREAPAVPPLHLPTAPLSRREIDYPGIQVAHEATAATTEDAVRAWREGAPEREPRRPSEAALVLPPPDAAALPGDALSAVIGRRGSSRAFAPGPIGLHALSVLLRQAAPGLPADLAGGGAARLTDLYLIVHAVEGIEGGSYRYDGQAHRLVPLRRGAFRREAGYLALEQALAAEAAVNVYCLADLGSVLGWLGPRGYRAAQLEGGVTGGRLYLTAYALGLGATGLTFYDDEVTTFFSPDAAGKAVMFLTAIGQPRRRRP